MTDRIAALLPLVGAVFIAAPVSARADRASRDFLNIYIDDNV